MTRSGRTTPASSITSTSWRSIYPDGDKNSKLNTYGYSTAQLMVHVLKQCGDDLTRENVIKQATNLKNSSRTRSVAARRQGQHHRERLPRQQADADDEVQRRALEIFGPILEDSSPAG